MKKNMCINTLQSREENVVEKVLPKGINNMIDTKRRIKTTNCSQFTKY